MTTNQETSNTVNPAAWDRTRNAIGIVLLVVISYGMGLSHGRSEKRMSEYSALKAQYDRVETEYFALKTQYERTENEYSALKAQYDRFETERTRSGINEPKR